MRVHERKQATSSDPDLERARGAFERRAWADAREAFEHADRKQPLERDELERYALSTALVGLDEDFVRVMERAHQAHLGAGEGRRAARAAFWIGMRLMAVGQHGRGAGWLVRARELVDAEPEPCVEHGYLFVPVALRHLAGGDAVAARTAADEAAAVGRRFHETDLLALARQIQGRTAMQLGRIDEGMALLDETLAAAASGELSPMVTGIAYCNAIVTCMQAFVWERAREWTWALASWCDAQPQMVSFTGACRAHRSAILRTAGAWQDALADATRVLDRHAVRPDHDAASDAFVQRGEVLRLLGDVAGAEEAYRAASLLGREPQPGLALLRLAAGDQEAASAAIRRVLASARTPLARARFLPAAVDILLAEGDLDEARRASSELDETASAVPTELLAAMASSARGAVQLAAGDAHLAADALQEALGHWRAVGAPFDEASIRVQLARAYRALGDTDAAMLELEAARAVFERLGAAPSVAAVETLLARPRPAGAHPLTPRELEVLRLVATGKTNKEIGRVLFVSEKTVDRHVSNLFAKLHVSSRAGATAYAYEHDLV